MAKRALSILLLILSISGCTFESKITEAYSENPFLNEVRLDFSSNQKALNIAFDTSTLKFVLATDQHYGREKRYPGMIYRWDDNFFDYLNTHRYPFFICLGDLSDSGEYADEVYNYIKRAYDSTTNGHFIYAIGNHERHLFDESVWTDEDSELIKHFTTMGKYVYSDILSIYKLDSSMRTWGSKQLDWLEEALKKDKSKYKIFITHDNITVGGTFDQSLFVTGYGDAVERNRLYRIMHDYKVGVILTGHHHKGNIEYHMSETMGELNLAAYHRMTNGFESDGFWYEFALDLKTGILSCDAYQAETGEKDSRYHFEFKLPEA